MDGLLNNVRTTTAGRRHRKGMAMLLAIFAILVVGTTTVAYVASRDTSVMVAANAQGAADARALSAVGMDITKQLLRDDDSHWRTNHTNGRLLDGYQIDGGTVTVDLIDIERRDAGITNPVPVAATTELEVTVTTERNGMEWQSMAHMSIPSVVKGQYAIFANKLFAMYGTDNFVGRWPNAPMSAQKLRVNIGSQALLASWNAVSPWLGSGVFIQAGANFETEVVGGDPEDPDTLKSTWIYYPYGASNFFVQGTGADKVAAKRMEPEDSVIMVPAPSAPSVSSPFTNYTSTQIVSGATTSYNAFRIKATFLSWLLLRNFEVRNNSTVTLNAGNYEIHGSWILRDSRIIINGDVSILVKTSLLATGLDWRDSTVELNANSSLTIYNGYSMDVRHCWVGPRYICTAEPNATLRDGDPHKRYWMTGNFTPTACDIVNPSSPKYFEPWRIRFYPDPSFLSNWFLWDIDNSTIVGSMFLPTNPIRFQGNSKVYGRVACNHLLIDEQASFYYDHALDELSGLTEGTAPSRGGDPEQMYPVRVIRYGFDADNSR